MIFRFFLSLLIPTIFGAGILSLIIRKKQSKIVSLICSFALGTGLTTYLMFWTGLLGLPFSDFIKIIIILATIILILLIKKSWKKIYIKGILKSITIKFYRLNILEIILILVIIFQFSFVFSESLMRPIINFDAVANWAFKAKVFFSQSQQAFDHTSSLFLGGGHQNYPLHVPLLMTWTYLWIGGVNDVIVGIIFALYFLSLICFIYFTLRSLTSRKLSLIFTTFLATLPLLSYHGFSAYADLILAFYFTVATVFVFKYLQQRNYQDLALAGIFAGLTTWVKNEGLMLVGVLLLAFMVYCFLKKSLFKNRGKVNYKICFKSVLYILCLVFPWLIFKKYFGLGYDNVSAGAVSFNGFHFEILPVLLYQLFFEHSFHFWFGFFVLIMLFRRNRIFNSSNLYLFLVILGVFCSYLVIYLFTPSYQFVVDGTIVGRNFLTIVPVSIFLAGALHS